MSDADRAGAYYQEQAQGHHGALVKAHERIRALEAALERLAAPTHEARTEEAALMQIEVAQIARDAMAASRGAG